MKIFSIIVPTLNEEPGILNFLNALQPYREFCEIIIADAHSTDNTKSISLPLVDQFISVPQGRGLQMNLGAKQASGEVMIFLHADTKLPEQALQNIQQGLDAGARWGRFDIQLIGQSFLLKVVAQMMNWRSRYTGIATGDQAIFITQAIFFEVGGFPCQALMEDIEISKRLKCLSSPYCIKAKVSSSARRWEKFGICRTILLMWTLRLRYFLGESPEVLNQLYRQGK